MLGGDHKHDQPVRAASGRRHCNSRSLCNVGYVLHTGSLQLHGAHLHTISLGHNCLDAQRFSAQHQLWLCLGPAIYESKPEQTSSAVDAGPFHIGMTCRS